MSDNVPITLRIGPTGVESTIVIDGQDVSRYVRKVVLTSDVNTLTTVEVTFIKVDVEAEGFVDVTGLGDWNKNYIDAKALKGERTR